MIGEVEASVGSLVIKKPKPMKMKVVEPVPPKPKKKYVIITMDYLAGRKPRDPDGLFLNNGYGNNYKRKKLSGKLLDDSNSSYAQQYRQERLAAKKKKEGPVKEDAQVKPGKTQNTDKKKKGPNPEDNNNQDINNKKTEPTDRRQKDSNEKNISKMATHKEHNERKELAKTSSDVHSKFTSPDFQKVPEDNYQQLQPTPDILDQTHSLNDSLHHNNPSPFVVKVDKQRPQKPIEVKPELTQRAKQNWPNKGQGPIDKNQIPTPTTDRSDPSADKTKIKDPVKLLDYRGAATGGYSAHYELKKSYQKASLQKVK